MKCFDLWQQIFYEQSSDLPVAIEGVSYLALLFLRSFLITVVEFLLLFICF